jgi:hypothetical protein
MLFTLAVPCLAGLWWSSRWGLKRRKALGSRHQCAAAPLYKPGVGAGNVDDTVRSKDRDTSDFIWNTAWQERVRSSPDINMRGS